MMEHFFPFDKVFIKPLLYSRLCLDMQRVNSITPLFTAQYWTLPLDSLHCQSQTTPKDQVVHTGPTPLPPVRQRNQLIDWTGRRLLYLPQEG